MNDRQRTQDLEKQMPLEVTIISFGYKQAPPPLANIVFDVRFLKNPYWEEDLRLLTGKDSAVQAYVLQQPLAQEFIASLLAMLDNLLPKLADRKIFQFSIAFGCTGGQHRSTTIVEELSIQLSNRFPQYCIKTQ